MERQMASISSLTGKLTLCALKLRRHNQSLLGQWGPYARQRLKTNPRRKKRNCRLDQQTRTRSEMQRLRSKALCSRGSCDCWVYTQRGWASPRWGDLSTSHGDLHQLRPYHPIQCCGDWGLKTASTRSIEGRG